MNLAAGPEKEEDVLGRGLAFEAGREKSPEKCSAVKTGIGFLFSPWTAATLFDIPTDCFGCLSVRDDKTRHD